MARCEICKENQTTGKVLCFECYDKIKGVLDTLCYLIEAERLAVLPCKIGAEIYIIPPDSFKSSQIVKSKFDYRHIDGVGKYVFLTLEEAEKALGGK